MSKDLRTIDAPLSTSVLCAGWSAPRSSRPSTTARRRAARPPNPAAPSEGAQRSAASFREAIAAGIEPAVVADAVAAAVAEDRFRIVPAQPDYLERIAARLDAVAARRNPD